MSYEVSVVEDLTGRVLNASDVEGTQVRQHDFEVQFADSPQTFQPGQLIVAKVTAVWKAPAGRAVRVAVRVARPDRA